MSSMSPYASVELTVPADLHPKISQFFGPGKPVGRMIDAWWLGLCIGVKHGEKRQRADEVRKFAEGTIFASDDWRIVHLELLAVAEKGEAILAQPREVIRLASSYADYGLEWVAERCLGANEPILALLSAIEVPAA
ncbi:hypothetical protein ACWCXL_12675 [Streptomyces sp. NPDC001588]